MNQEQLNEIKQRAEKATPGPMEIVWDSRPDIKTELIFTKRKQGGFWDGGHIASLTHHRTWQSLLRLCERLINKLPEVRDRVYLQRELEELNPELAKYGNSNDAEFYAHALEDNLTLVAEVERLTKAMSLSGVADTMAKYVAEIERLEAENEQLKQDINRMVY
jgi:uncharacterized small protein (DUF1192 family)